MIKLRRQDAATTRYKYDKDDKGAKAGIPSFRKECLTLTRGDNTRQYN